MDDVNREATYSWRRDQIYKIEPHEGSSRPVSQESKRDGLYALEDEDVSMENSKRDGLYALEDEDVSTEKTKRDSLYALEVEDVTEDKRKRDG